jgi:hypothetical protein
MMMAQILPTVLVEPSLSQLPNDVNAGSLLWAFILKHKMYRHDKKK